MKRIINKISKLFTWRKSTNPKAIIYARFSSESQCKDDNTMRQLEVIEELVKRKQ